MKFTVETEPFLRMLAMLAQARPERRRAYAPVRLDAAGERLRVQQDQLGAEIEAVVWQNGRCAASLARLQAAVKACAPSRTLLVQAEGDRLEVGEFTLPCAPECPAVAAFVSCRIFFASDLGVVPSLVPQLSLATA